MGTHAWGAAQSVEETAQHMAVHVVVCGNQWGVARQCSWHDRVDGAVLTVHVHANTHTNNAQSS